MVFPKAAFAADASKGVIVTVERVVSTALLANDDDMLALLLAATGTAAAIILSSERHASRSACKEAFLRFHKSRSLLGYSPFPKRRPNKYPKIAQIKPTIKGMSQQGIFSMLFYFLS